MEILVDYIGDNNTAVDFLKMCGSEELQTKCEGKQTANGWKMPKWQRRLVFLCIDISYFWPAAFWWVIREDNYANYVLIKLIVC